MASRPAQFLPVRLTDSDRHRLGKTLTEAALLGYCYGGTTPLLARGSAGFYNPTPGTYVNNGLVWLQPAGANSLFHTHVLPMHRKKPEDCAADLNELAAAEAQAGFGLADVIPIDGFHEREPGPGTVGLVAIFERPGGSGTPLALDRYAMKPERPDVGDRVPCPVLGCTHTVPRMTAGGPNLNDSPDKLADYLCPDHQIYISPSTFAYRAPQCSLIWLDAQEEEALARITGGGKRTWTRMARERDEDSLTWNTFRSLQRLNRVGKTLQGLLPGYQTKVEPEVVYWSVDPTTPDVWAPLARVREQLAERPGYGSEPDLIVVSPEEVTIIEVKFTSPAVTDAPATVPVGYLEEPLWSQVFQADKNTVIKEIGYELMRYFLAGRLLADHLDRPFRLVSLTRPEQDKDLVARVQKVSTGAVRYDHVTWQQVHDHVSGNDAALKLLARYLEGKTAGYEKGVLQTLL